MKNLCNLSLFVHFIQTDFLTFYFGKNLHEDIYAIVVILMFKTHGTFQSFTFCVKKLRNYILSFEKESIQKR